MLSPEDLSNSNVDELSGMTYLSYFLKKEGPGWYATLNWVRAQIPETNVENFQVGVSTAGKKCIISLEYGLKIHFFFFLNYKKKKIKISI